MIKQGKYIGKKVFVGLSGGVDSSVSAALLKEQGFNVHGVFIKVWQPDFELTGGCTWRQDRLDAMRVCAKLNIPFYTLDLEKEYKKEVVDYMISEYQAGRTPNPDVMCNKYVKFGGFFDWAMNHEADYIATGHYAIVKKIKDKFVLLAGKDKNKDQSYFLWTITQKQLSKTIFPVGDIEKPMVRKLAKRYNLLTAFKKDSQGLCFIGKVDMKDFLKHFLKVKPGKILNTEGQVVGIHDGAELFTIGQRHGFTITKSSPNNNRMFVVSKNTKNNTITISEKINTNSTPEGNSLFINKVNWVLGSQPDLSKPYQARIRYRGNLSDCSIKRTLDNSYEIIFKKSQNSPAVGQSVVIYNGNICLGGGVIC